MNTNIEPGCLCMVTDPDNFGATVYAENEVAKEGEYVMVSENLMARSIKKPLWKISKNIYWSEKGYVIPYSSERYLMPIDTNPDEVKQIEKEEVL